MASAYVQFSICLDCGLIFQNPRMTQETVNKFYSFVYRQIYVDRGEEAERAGRLCDALKKIKFSSHLDIGSGTGLFAGLTEARFGCHSVGIDIRNDREALGKYELVTSIHCLEHTLDPVAELQFMADHSERYVMIEVPPVGCPGALAHPLEFQPWTLRGLVRTHFDILVYTETNRFTNILAERVA
jgi:hypothetical protein